MTHMDGYDVALSRGMLDVVRERHRQINQEGFDDAWDNGYTQRELTQAAVSFAVSARAALLSNEEIPSIPPQSFPWSVEWWKPKSPRRALVKAAALLMAEIDCIDRAEKRKESGR